MELGGSKGGVCERCTYKATGHPRQVCAQASSVQQGHKLWPEKAWGPSCKALPMTSRGLGFALGKDAAGGTTAVFP